MTGLTVEENDARKRVLDHAWDWWKYHADQRIALIRFYILTLGGVAAAVGWLLQQHESLLSALISGLGAILSFCFLRLGTRTADLVKIGEDALSFEEGIIASATGNEKIQLCCSADSQRRYWPYSYGEIISPILSVIAVLFLTMVGICLIR